MQINESLTKRQHEVLRAILAQQPLHELELDVEDLKAEYTPGLDVSRSEGISLLRRLDELGLGDFKIGRRGRPTRLEWSVGVRKGLAEETEVSKEEGQSSPSAGQIMHQFQLRPTLAVELVLPSDLTQHEAARLAAFVQALPFDPSPAVQEGA